MAKRNRNERKHQRQLKEKPKNWKSIHLLSMATIHEDLASLMPVMEKNVAEFKIPCNLFLISLSYPVPNVSSKFHS